MVAGGAGGRGRASRKRQERLGESESGSRTEIQPAGMGGRILTARRGEAAEGQRRGWAAVTKGGDSSPGISRPGRQIAVGREFPGHDPVTWARGM